ncbi:MAG: outer membrane protein assembly factor, partial [Xanthomonadales bacterium]|nr:outer membrane protein assembly factor [Xanthomonadales bacterium]
MTGFRRRSRTSLSFWLLLALCAPAAEAARVTVQLDGIDGDLRAAALGAVELQQYESREVSLAQVRRLYRRAESQIKQALEPYGYYDASIDGELLNEGENFRAILHVKSGQPVKVSELSIGIGDEARKLRAVSSAVSAFSPQKGQRLDHAAYERSKAAIHASLFSVGYLDAELATHRVEVERASNTAKVELEWKLGPRYRFADTNFEGGQFGDDFMQRFIPWDVG